MTATKPLTAPALDVLAALRRLADGRATFAPSNAELVRASGRSLECAVWHLWTLEQAGLVRVEAGAGRRRRTITLTPNREEK